MGDWSIAMTLSMCSRPFDRVVRARLFAGAVNLRGQRAVQDVVDQRRFAAARNAGDHGEHAQRNFHVDVLQVVLARAPDHRAFSVAGARRPAGTGDFELARKILAGERSRIARDRRAACPRPPARRPAGRRPGPDRSRSRRARWSRRRAPPPAPYCPCRAAAPAFRAAGRCRAGAARWRARPARRARRAAWSRSAWPAGCAAPRRRRAWRRSGPGSDSPGPRRTETPGGSRISSTTRPAICVSRSSNSQSRAVSSARAIGSPVNSAMEMPFTRTARLAGRSRLPLAVGALDGRHVLRQPLAIPSERRPRTLLQQLRECPESRWRLRAAAFCVSFAEAPRTALESLMLECCAPLVEPVLHVAGAGARPEAAFQQRLGRNPRSPWPGSKVHCCPARGRPRRRRRGC